MLSVFPFSINKKKILFWGSPNAATPLNEIYLVFIFGERKYFLYSFYKDNWRGRVKDNEVNLIDDIECKARLHFTEHK